MVLAFPPHLFAFSLYFLTQTFFNFPRRFELLGVNCSLALCIHFSCCKGTVFTIWINHKTRIFPLLSHSNKMHLLALLGFQQPKWQIFLPLSGGASLYRPLWEVPPGSKNYSRGCRKNIPYRVIKCSTCERYNNREGVEGMARKATGAVFSISPSLLFIHVPTMPPYILNIYAGFSQFYALGFYAGFRSHY